MADLFRLRSPEVISVLREFTAALFRNGKSVQGLTWIMRMPPFGENCLIVLQCSGVGIACAKILLITPLPSSASVPLLEEPPMKKSRGAGVEKSAEASSKHDDDFFGFATCVICQEVIHRATCIRLVSTAFAAHA